jgi:hypothetical protein
MKFFRAAREWCPAGLHEAVSFERFGISPSAAGADTFARGTEGSNPSSSSGESLQTWRARSGRRERDALPAAPRPTQLRKEIFGDNFPASALITVAGLARPEMLVEVQGIAVLG